jgi:TPR repeat protein
MKKNCLLVVLCLVLTAWPVMAEETEKASSLIEEARVLIEAEDYEAVVPLLQEAADMGNADGQNMLGNCYMSGLGIEQDEEEAVKYYQLAADQGNIQAE